MRRVALLSLLAAAALLAGGLVVALVPREVGPLPGREPVEALPFVGEDEPVRFLAWGDAGHGSPEQRATADAAARVCREGGCDLVVGLGDNVYDNGVESLHDHQFEAKFEDPYANLPLPFYMVLGNHDVRGNVTAQVDYSNVSDKWEMPARHYSFRQGDVLFVALDLTALDEGDASGAGALGAWVDETLAQDARWKVAFSHFPYASGGRHGNGSAQLRAFLEEHVCGKADLYLSGHDHDLQWLREQPGCAGTELVVSGAASQARPLGETPVDAHFAVGGTRGFFWFEATEDRLLGRAYDAEGKVLFERELRRGGR